MKHVTVCLSISVVLSSCYAGFMTCAVALLINALLRHGLFTIAYRWDGVPMVLRTVGIVLWLSGPLLFIYGMFRERGLLRRRLGKLALGAASWFVFAHLALAFLLGIDLLLVKIMMGSR